MKLEKSRIEGAELEFCRRGREKKGTATAQTAVYCSHLNIHTAARKREWQYTTFGSLNYRNGFKMWAFFWSKHQCAC